MAPKKLCVRPPKLGTTEGAGKRKITRSGPPRWRPCSGFLLLDIVDDFGHVVLVLAEFGGVLDQLLFLLLALLERHCLFLVLRRFDILLGLGIGFDLLGTDRLQLLLDRRRRPRPPRLQQSFGIERRRTFWADDRLAQQVV